MGEFTTIMARDGHEFQAYLAAPPGKPRGAVVVLQEIFGVNAHIRTVTDSYAAEGYTAIAPSLFATGLTEGIPDEFAATLTKDAAFPKRLGRPDEYGKLAVAIVENPMLNGLCIRLDAGTRFAPK